MKLSRVEVVPRYSHKLGKTIYLIYVNGKKLSAHHTFADAKKSAQMFIDKEKKQNPPISDNVKIYGRLIRIEAQKTQDHICDNECKAVNHKYFHDFKSKPEIWGLPNGDLLIKARS